jgi:uncharacterized protein
VELHTIPFQDKFLIYRPLRKLAFVGNRAMAELCGALAREGAEAPRPEGEACRFLEAAGFFEPDVPAPEPAAGPGEFRPTVCVLFLTQKCGLRCIYCYAGGGDGPKAPDMDPALARTAIEEVSRSAAALGRGHYELCFHGGGEPLEAWELLKRSAEYARSTPLKAVISLTSGGMWTDSQRAWITENIDQVSLSFDGLPGVQNSQRPQKSGAGSHAAVWKTIKALDAADVPYGIRVTVTDQFVAKLPENIEYLCRETGAGAIQVEPAFAHGRARSADTALKRQSEFARSFMEGYDTACLYKRHMYYSGARPWLLTSSFCGAYDSALIAGHSGFLTFCYEVCDHSHELADSFIFGRLSSGGGITLDSRAREAFFGRLERRRKRCRSCFCFHHCAGDCPAKTFSRASGEHSLKSRCRLNREITKNILLRYIEQGDGVWRGALGRPGEAPA